MQIKKKSANNEKTKIVNGSEMCKTTYHNGNYLYLFLIKKTQ